MSCTIDLVELDSSIWDAIESLRGRKIVRIKGYPPLYVSKTDYAKLWPESPHDMMEKGYTIKASLQAKARLFGGIMKAKVGLDRSPP